MIIIAKNQTAGDLALPQLPVPDNEVPASGQVVLTNYSTIPEIQSDAELLAHIVAGNCILNVDGTDLTQAQSEIIVSPPISGDHLVIYPFGAKSDDTGKFIVANGKSTDADDATKPKTRQPIIADGTLEKIAYKVKDGSAATTMKIHINGTVEATFALVNINANQAGVEAISVPVLEGDYLEIEYDSSQKPGESTWIVYQTVSSTTANDPQSPWRLAYEVDFASEASVDLTGVGGTHTIGGKTWNMINPATATSMDLDGSTGMVVQTPNTKDMPVNAIIAPCISVALADLMPADWNPTLHTRIWFHCTSTEFQYNGPAMGVWDRASTIKQQYGIVRESGATPPGTRTLFCPVFNQRGTNVVYVMTSPSVLHSWGDVFCIDKLAGYDQFLISTGTYASGWPTDLDVACGMSFRGSNSAVDVDHNWPSAALPAQVVEGNLEIYLGIVDYGMSGSAVATFHRMAVEYKR